MEDTSFEQLESLRLCLRRFRLDDAAAFAEYRNDPEVARLQGWDVPYSIDEAHRFVESMEGVSPGRPGTWFQFAVALRSNGALIGDCALHTARDAPRQAELGFSFARPYQRHGYASEALSYVVGYAFTTLEMQRVFSIIDARNERAQRLLERLSFRREGLVEATWFKGELVSEFLYAQLASEWRPMTPKM